MTALEKSVQCILEENKRMYNGGISVQIIWLMPISLKLQVLNDGHHHHHSMWLTFSISLHSYI